MDCVVTAPGIWDQYLVLQAVADRQRLDHKAWALDEALEEFLNAALDGSLRARTHRNSGWVANIATNRAKKHRRRVSLLRASHREQPLIQASCRPLGRMIAAESAELARAMMSERERRVFAGLSAGNKFESIASDEKCSVGALRTMVSRCRKRIQAAAA